MEVAANRRIRQVAFKIYPIKLDILGRNASTHLSDSTCNTSDIQRWPIP